MDTEKGIFVNDKDAKEWMERLEENEIVKLKGSEFKVLAINDRTVILLLLSNEDRQQDLVDITAGIKGFDNAAEMESKRQLEKVFKHQK